MQSPRLKFAVWLGIFVLLVVFVGLFVSGSILIVTGLAALLGLALACVVFRSAMLPLMNITRYASRVTNGNYGSPCEGQAVSEYGQLKEIIDVVDTNASDKGQKGEGR